MASLGTLTVDLVAKTGGFVRGLDKGSREAAKFRRQVKRNMEEVARGFKIATGAAVAGLAAVTTETVRAGKEIQRLSRIANTSTQEFQRYAVGARQVGIDQEKLSDIFKDTSDRVGDFLTTGGGPLLDFFEQIAPKIGVTAEQFRNLSGPQALQLYVDSLEKANVSQNELVFFLEAVAGDASALIPLLKNGGEAFGVFADEAERAGSIIDDKTLEAQKRLSAELFVLQESAKGVRFQIGRQVIPVLSDLAQAFTNTQGDTQEFTNEAGVVEDVLRFIVSRAAAAAGAIQLVGKSVGGLAAIFAALGRQEGEGFLSTAPLARAAEVARALRSDLDNTAQTYADLVRRFETGDTTAAEDRLAGLRDALNAASNRPTATPSGVTPTPGGGPEPGTPPSRPDLGGALDPDDEFLQPQEQFEDVLTQREDTFQKHKDNMLAIEQATNGQLSDAARALVGEQSAIYQALFITEKAAAVARSIVAIQTALANASASGPFPANLAAIASVASATAGIISTITSTQIQGQAHDGMMNVPRTGSYILEQGERVTPAETTAKMDSLLDNLQSGGGMGGGVRIVNTFDTPDVVGGYMGSSDGERVIMNVVRKNQRTIRSLAAI